MAGCFGCIHVFLSMMNNCENCIFGTPFACRQTDEDLETVMFAWRCAGAEVVPDISSLGR